MTKRCKMLGSTAGPSFTLKSSGLMQTARRAVGHFDFKKAIVAV